MVTVIDETESDLRRLVEADFGAIKQTDAFQGALLNWLHWQARCVPLRPREVIESSEIEAARSQFSAIRLIERDLRNGADVGPWMSDSVRVKKSDHRADMLFNDWQIVHFHLSPVFQSPQKTKRSNDLLFARIEADRAIFLDVAPHGTWTREALLKILFRTCPDLAAKLQLKGVLAPREQYDDAAKAKLRKAGIVTLSFIDGQTFMPPGLGVTTSGHAMRIGNHIALLQRSIADIRAKVESNSLPQSIGKMILANLALPVRLGIRLDAGCFVIFDKNRMIPFIQLPCLE